MTVTTKDKVKMAELKAYMEDRKGQEHPESYLIAILHKAQGLFGYIDRELMDEISVSMDIPSAHIWGVVTFYHYFTLEKPGEHIIHVCMGTACYVKGADKIVDALKKELKIDFNETTEDGLFSLREARCLGACGIAPVIMIDDKMYGELTPESTIELLGKYRRQNKEG